MTRRDPFIESALKDLDEMSHFPSDDARRRAVDHHIKETNRPINMIFGTIYLIVACLLAQWLLRLLARATFPVGMPRYSYPIFIITGTTLVYYLVLRALHRWGTRLELRKRLHRDGVAVCLKCGYLLQGLKPGTPVCPECGRRISPRTQRLLETRPQ